jgi:hypothetical protein
MPTYKLNEPIVHKGNVYMLVQTKRLGLDLYGIMIRYDGKNAELRTFNDITIARMTLNNLLNRI